MSLLEETNVLLCNRICVLGGLQAMSAAAYVANRVYCIEMRPHSVEKKWSAVAVMLMLWYCLQYYMVDFVGVRRRQQQGVKSCRRTAATSGLLKGSRCMIIFRVNHLI